MTELQRHLLIYNTQPFLNIAVLIIKKIIKFFKIMKLLFFILTLLFFISCEDNEGVETGQISKEEESREKEDAVADTVSKTKDVTISDIIISEDLYKSSINSNHIIDNLTIEDDVLIIKYTSSGCDGNSWELKLIDADIIKESYPPQRDLKLLLKNEELCLASITKEIRFNIAELKTEGSKVQLNFNGTEKRILFEY